MKIGILETGAPPPGLVERFGDYGAMFRDLLGPGYDYVSYDVAAGKLPGAADEAQAFLITGSSAGVYDDLPWIAPLGDFLKSVRGRVPLVGVCFGHQMMAEAFGGKVIKSPKGWGVGLNRYMVEKHADWMDGGDTLAVPGSHQDQVVELPPGVEVLAGSDFCPYGLLDYPGDKAMSVQLHPEFKPPYAQALIEARRGSRYTEAQADTAIASLQLPNDNARLGGWIGDFLARSVG
ncbi:GMP synthase-like glutamine amidotransferase [Caulobacter ginsengisoli]|uniref:GMP synthase-like glutamine amidotransferase n=1 Tax=Caulobacter ginsengisoli TaxID=400775 RepID=A0ABU0IVI9_9CAUL|nr:type 1 glutamine amidotransferase [Caulobacter ginsengisoli]MDQ0466029.1 GMP synthase-like glutamine amidotransferase [Caulobacter ginsengisoli]